MAGTAQGGSERVAAALRATAYGIGGFIAIVAWVILLGTALGVDQNTAPTMLNVVSTVAGGLGTGSVALLYLRRHEKGLEFIDIPRPGLRHAAYAVVVPIVLIVLNVLLQIGFDALGAETAEHGIIQQARSNPEILLPLIPLAYLVIGPGEELLYRNVVQKSLYEAFSARASIVIASAIFAVAHFTSYLALDAPLSTLNGLLMVFFLSLVLGGVYYRTRSVIVVAFAHASFDAIAFAVTYVQLTA